MNRLRTRTLKTLGITLGKSLGAGLLMSAVLGSCVVQAPVDPDKVIIFGKAKDAVTLDPADTEDGESSAVVVNVTEPLLRFKPESTLVEPALAESYTISDDKLTWTFKLRKNVVFHDGTPFNAEAVKFNYDRQMDPKNPWRFKGAFIFWDQFFKAVKAVEVQDEHTLIMRLSRPDATFKTNLAVYTMGISSPTAIKKYGENFFKNPVGTGPFKFDRWVPNEKIKLVRNETYWGPKPHIDMLIYKPVPDNAVRLLELETNSINVLDGINPDDVTRIRKDPNLKLLTQPGLNVGYLAMNNSKPPFDKREVRLAISHAINKAALVKAFFAEGTLGLAAVNPMPSTVWGYNSQIKDYDYNPEKAKALLKQAGFPNGFETKLWTMPIARPYMPQPARIAESIQADLQKVGIKAEIVTFEWGTYLSRLGKGEHTMALAGWIGDNGDPDNFLYTILDKNNIPGSNYAFYKGEQVHELLIKAQQVYDQSERTKLYEQVQAVVKQDAPLVPLFHSTQMMATRAGVDGLHLHPVGEKRFETIMWSQK